MNTLQTLVNIALDSKSPVFRQWALSQIETQQWHAMEVEREFEELEAAYSSIPVGDSVFLDCYDVIYDIHTANKNGALA